MPMKIAVYTFILAAFVAISALGMVACGSLASEDKAVSLLENQGFENVEIVERDVFFVSLKGCSEQDVALFTATGTNPIGKEVEVEVCVGWPFKGATMRG